MRLGAGDLAPQAGSEHELYRRSQQASQERLEMPATLRRAGSIARLFAGPEPHTMQFDLDALMNVQTACQSLEGTNVGPRTRGIPGYEASPQSKTQYSYAGDQRALYTSYHIAWRLPHAQSTYLYSIRTKNSAESDSGAMAHTSRLRKTRSGSDTHSLPGQ